MRKIILLLLITICISGCTNSTVEISTLKSDLSDIRNNVDSLSEANENIENFESATDELISIINSQKESLKEQDELISNLQLQLDAIEKNIVSSESKSNKDINKPESLTSLPLLNYFATTNNIAETFIKAYVANDIETMKMYVADYILISEDGITMNLTDYDMSNIPFKDVDTMQVPLLSAGSKYVFEDCFYDDGINNQYYEFGIIYTERYGVEFDVQLRINESGVVTYIAVFELGI